VAPQPDRFLGRTVKGRFQVLKKLGQGGMGSVYEAEDLKLGMRAAVKFLNPQLSGDVELARRFLYEAKTIARVVHPGAVTLQDFGQDDDGTLYIAMELVEGQTLSALLNERRRLPLPEAADIALQIASVLETAHEKGVVHRDLKPENVMVRRGLHGWHVKLLDFGVARRIYAGATQLTQAGGVAGTPRYMAPEQARGEEVDGRVDVYALGLLLFEMLTGVPAIDAPDPHAMLAQQLSRGIRSLGSVDPDVANDRVDRVLAAATHRERVLRYGSMHEFAQGLQKALGAGAETVPPVVPAAPLEKTFTAKATPYPLAPPPGAPATAPAAVAPASRRREWLMWTLIALALGIAGATAGLVRRQVVVAAPPPGACPGASLYEPELRELSTAELERQVASLPILPPSTARKQLERLKTTTETYAAGMRECAYRTLLLGSVAASRTVLKTTPAMWGQTRELRRLRSLFLELPLKQPWTPEQRGAVLERIDRDVIPHLQAEDDADREYWRRQYYGIELLCEVTDDALRELHTQRPDSCLNFTP
jgi:serine/threonine protein kinase